MHLFGLILILCIGFVVGCDNQVEYESGLEMVAVSYSSFEDEQKFIASLRENEIPHEINLKGGIREISWHPAYSQQVKQVDNDLFGHFPPPGLSISPGPNYSSDFKSWLKQKNIQYELLVYKENEYVVWSKSDNTDVRKHPIFRKMDD